MGKILAEGLLALKNRYPLVREVRGKGLLLGMELDREGSPIVGACLKAGLLLNCTANRVLRFFPPLIIQKKEVERALTVLEKALAHQ